MARKIRLIEEVSFSKPGSAGVLLGDAVKEAGLDPRLFIAVIPGECGMAGRVNGNRRIYQPKEGITQHETLCREASKRFIVGERDHPEAGPSWNAITRFLGGQHRVAEKGVVYFDGRFGLMNTSLGRDTLVQWEAGVPVGVSSNGRGYAERHKLDEKSPFLAMNEDHKGEEVWLISGWELDGYDWVRVPSASTFLTPPQRDVGEAMRRVREAMEIQEVTMFKDFAEFAAAHPDLAKQFKQEVIAENAATGLPDVKALIEAATKPLIESANADREKVKGLELAVEAKGETVKELAEKLGAAEAKATKMEVRATVVTEMDQFVVGRKAGAKLRDLVLADFDEGMIKTLDEAKARAERYGSIVTEATALPGTPAPVVPPKVTEASDGGVTKPDNPAAKLSAAFG